LAQANCMKLYGQLVSSIRVSDIAYSVYCNLETIVTCNASVWHTFMSSACTVHLNVKGLLPHAP